MHTSTDDATKQSYLERIKRIRQQQKLDKMEKPIHMHLVKPSRSKSNNLPAPDKILDKNQADKSQVPSLYSRLLQAAGQATMPDSHSLDPESRD